MFVFKLDGVSFKWFFKSFIVCFFIKYYEDLSASPKKSRIEFFNRRKRALFPSTVFHMWFKNLYNRVNMFFHIDSSNARAS